MEAFRAEVTITLVWMVFSFFEHHPTMFQENLSGLYCFEWCSDFFNTILLCIRENFLDFFSTS